MADISIGEDEIEQEIKKSSLFVEVEKRKVLTGDKVREAVQVLSKFIAIPRRRKFLGDEERVDIQFGFKKIPLEKKKNYKIPIPHSFITDTSDICLFVKDLDKNREADYEVTKEHFKQLLLRKGVSGISEVIPLRQLRKEYKPFEARRNLVNMYTLFLADERIVRFLPTILGKEFFIRKKYPVSVHLQRVDLDKEIKKAFSKTYLKVSAAGSCSKCQVGLLTQPEDDLVNNIITVVQFLADKLPGGWRNIRTMGIKTLSSMSIPLYISEGSANNVKLPEKVKIKQERPSEGELSTLGRDVKVFSSGFVKVVSQKQDRKPGSFKKKVKKLK